MYGIWTFAAPRSPLKKAFEIELINDGQNWLELSADRNLATHTYDEEKAMEIVLLIREKYYPLLEQLYQTFKGIQNE